ncbi:MAG TPA: hypothetical protein DET40_05235 [Lentisphaeria bacterium]|nr:MAG: hypothetical protein A2X45_20460 [Lentisphaerae bacterium GWF2_50_93]HCE42930.1 hypothetical protein [Lentisphaeria bacterium]
MSNISKEIDQIVQDAARKKKELDKLKEDTEKTGFTAIAVDDRKKFEHDLKHPKTDHTKTFLIILCSFLVIFAIVLIYEFVQLNRESEKIIWEKPAIGNEVPDKARDYVSGLLAKGNITLDSHLKSGIPVPWRKNAEKIYKEINLGRGQVLEAVKDEKQLGSIPRIKVVCSSSEPNTHVIFNLLYIKNEFQILNIEKRQMNAETKTGVVK